MESFFFGRGGGRLGLYRVWNMNANADGDGDAALSAMDWITRVKRPAK